MAEILGFSASSRSFPHYAPHSRYGHSGTSCCRPRWLTLACGDMLRGFVVPVDLGDFFDGLTDGPWDEARAAGGLPTFSQLADRLIAPLSPLPSPKVPPSEKLVDAMRRLAAG